MNFLFAKWCLVLSAAAAASPSHQAVEQAKIAMVAGKRKVALEQLDRARVLTKKKSELREIAAKRAIFTEQFLTSESFQRYQEAKGLADPERWDECLRELEPMEVKDQDNLLVLRLKARCQVGSAQYDAAATTLTQTLTFVPGDLSAVFGLVEIALAQKKFPDGLALLKTSEPKASIETERHAILKAKLLEASSLAAQAADVLREDQEAHLDHVEVLYELGMLYTRMPGHDWPARKMLSLFIIRCKRMSEAELKLRRFDSFVVKAQTALSAIDRKLGV